MFISTERVNLDGLANTINLYAYCVITREEEVDCATCAYETCEYQPGLNEWFFVFDDNVLRNEVFCKSCSRQLALPVRDDNAALWRDLLHELYDAGGVHLPDRSWNEIIETFVNEQGKSLKRVLPGAIVYNEYLCETSWVNVKQPIRKAVIGHFETTKKLFVDVANMFKNFLSDFKFNSYYSAKNYYKGIDEAYQLLLSNLFSCPYVINKPIDLKLFNNEKREIYSVLKQKYKYMFDKEKQEDDSNEYEFSGKELQALMEQFLDSIPPIVFEQHLTSCVVRPYTSTYAEAAYDLCDWNLV